MKWFRRFALFVLFLAIGPLLSVACSKVNLGQHWSAADTSPSGLAPSPAQEPEAVVQVYAARAFNWRGIFAVHTWIAIKPANARSYTVHQVMGWRAWRGQPVVVSRYDYPDRFWYGAIPEVVSELRGEAATAAIPKIERAVQDYPYANRYSVWPGPNSNTFTAFVGRQVPELKMNLPVTAIGKDYLPGAALFDETPSTTGYQFSVYGLFGLLAAREEGLELNVLGLSFGIDAKRPGIKLPGLGRVGL